MIHDIITPEDHNRVTVTRRFAIASDGKVLTYIGPIHPYGLEVSWIHDAADPAGSWRVTAALYGVDVHDDHQRVGYGVGAELPPIVADVVTHYAPPSHLADFAPPAERGTP